MKKYIRPKLTGHKVLYKGLRYWVFEVSPAFPFESYEDYYNIVLYDCLHDGVITGGKIGEDGVIHGDVQFGQGKIDVSGKTLIEFIQNSTASSDWVHAQS